MPAPTGRDLYVDQLLTNILVGYRNLAFIAGEIGNPLKVNQITGIIPKILQSQWFRNLAQPRKGGTKATESGFGTDITATYLLSRFSHAVRVLDDDRKVAAGGPFEMDKLATMLAANIVDLKREITLSAAFFASGKGWTDLAAGADFTAWDDLAASNPMLDVDKARDTMEAKIGASPRTLIVGRDVYTRGLKWNPALLDVIRFTQKGVLSQAQVAEILDIEIKVGSAIYTTAVEGTAESSVTYSRVWGKSALLLNQPAGLDMTAPGLARISRTVAGGERWVRRFRYDEEEYDKFEANTEFQYKQIDARAGTFFGTVVS